MANLKCMAIAAGGAACFDDTQVASITCDSRKAGRNDAFIAFPGEVCDGRAFIGKTDAGVVIYESGDGFEPVTPAKSFGVCGLRKKLPAMAAAFFGDPSANGLKVAGITGTNGKSSTSWYLAQLIDAAGGKCGVIGTVGNGFVGHLVPSVNTTPGPIEIQQTLLAMKEAGATHVAMEVSSHGIAQGRIDGVTFAATAFTNFTQDHLDFHGTMEEYFAVKRGFILNHGGVPSVLNADDPEIAKNLADAAGDRAVLMGSRGAYQVSGIKATGAGTSFVLCRGQESAALNLPLIGAFNVMNAVMALALAESMLGKRLDPRLLEGLKPLSGRMELFKTPDSPLCLVDYAHTPDGVEKAAAAAREHVSGKVVAVLGCGGDRDKTKRPIMAKTALDICDELIITDDNPRTEDPEAIVRDMISGISGRSNFSVVHDRKQAIEKAVKSCSDGDAVLIAGKGHEDYQIVGAERRHFSDQETVREILDL